MGWGRVGDIIFKYLAFELNEERANQNLFGGTGSYRVG